MIQAILRDIAATQNFQIQGMRHVLELNNYAKTADCVVEISRSIEMDDSPVTAPVSAPTKGSSGAPTWSNPMVAMSVISLLLYTVLC
jgi:hypothetical protein